MQRFVDASTYDRSAPRFARAMRRLVDRGVAMRAGGGAPGRRGRAPRARARGGRLARLSALAIAVALLLLGCGAPPCASSLACGEGLVCGLDGRCRALDAPAGSRFAGSRWLEARNWGLATRDPRPLADALVIGGPAGSEARLAFGPLPPPSRILHALLVLHPWDPDARVVAPGEIVIEHVEPFRGGRRPARLTVTPTAFAAARHALPPGPARPLRVDLSALAAAAAARSDRTLYLLVRLEGGDPAGARFASPWSPSAPRPRLELMLH